MLCAAIDIGSNTTRVLVAEPQEGQLRKVMEQRAYTRIGKGSQHDGAIDADKVGEVADVVATQIRLAKEVGAEAIRTVATAAIREATNRTEVVAEIARVAGVEVEVLSEHEEGRLAFIGATKTLGHPVEGDVAVVDVDRETGEELEVVAELLPVAPTPSELPWAVENLRFCNWCDQLAQKDLNDCPHCGRRMAAIERS